MNMKVRMYEDGDYKVIDPWFSALSKFYDGHTPDKKLIDQLVNRQEKDAEGFFTLSKEIYICEENGAILGFFCLNYKRGEAVKLGPLVVAPGARGKGVGSFLYGYIDILCRERKFRKLYATTSQLNAPVNALFNKFGYKEEAVYPDQYKKGSNEVVWGKVFTPDTFPVAEQNSMVLAGDRPITLSDFNEKLHMDGLTFCDTIFSEWHDDLGADFIEATLNGYKRGREAVDFQTKTKSIIVASSESGIDGIGVFSPKRGGAGKLYPFYGTQRAQREIITTLKAQKDFYGVHKIYSFCSLLDAKQQATFIENGFVQRGVLDQPYKPNTRLTTFDLFI